MISGVEVMQLLRSRCFFAPSLWLFSSISSVWDGWENIIQSLSLNYYSWFKMLVVEGNNCATGKYIRWVLRAELFCERNLYFSYLGAEHRKINLIVFLLLDWVGNVLSPGWLGLQKQKDLCCDCCQVLDQFLIWSSNFYESL